MEAAKTQIFDEPVRLAYDIYRNYFSKPGYDALKYRCDFMLTYLLITLGIQLDHFPFTKDYFCGMLILDEYETTIVYNSKHSPERRNFTIAHELGHFLLHRNKQSQFVDRAENMLDNCINEFEKQANAFAAELLLPEPVLNLMLGYRYSFFRIAKTTYTSYECLKWRLVTHLMRNYSLVRSDSIAIVEDYRRESIKKKHADSAIFKILFPGDRNFELINGELVEYSTLTNKVIARTRLIKDDTIFYTKG